MKYGIKRRWISISAAMVLFFAILLLPLPQETLLQAPELVLNYAENQPEQYPTTQAAYYFAELVKQRSDGRILINVYADGEFGDERSVVEQLQYGGVDMARVSVMSLSQFFPSLNILQMPYLYQDAQQMWSVLDGEIGDYFLQVVSEGGLVGLSWYDAGARHLYNRIRPIECLEDLKGMRIRVSDSALMWAFVEAVQAEPVTLEYSQVYTQLQTGQIDGAENNQPAYTLMEHYEVAPYITLDAHSRIPEQQVISQVVWDQLSAEDQELIRSCAQESAIYQRQLWEKWEEQSVLLMQEHGCTVTVLSPEERERFRQVAEQLYRDFLSEQDLELLNTIRLQLKTTP